MQYNISLIQQLNRLLTRCIMYFILFATVLIIYDKGLTKVYLLAGIPLVLVCFFLIERYIYQGIPYLLLHGIFFIPAILLPFPSKVYSILYCILLVIECYHGQYVWKHNMDTPYSSAPWEFYLFITIICLIAKAYHYEQIVNIIFYCGILLLILHFIQLYIEGLRGVLIKAQNATSVPTKKMILFSAMMVSFILVVFCISCLLSRNYDLDAFVTNLGKWLGEVLLAAIKWFLYIITLLRAYFARNRKSDNLEEQQDAYRDAFSDLTNDVSNPSMIADIIYGFFAVLVYGFMIYLLYQGFKRIYATYVRRYVTDADIITTLSPSKDVTKPKKNETTLMEKLKQNIKQDNRMKLRRIYRLFIRRHKEYYHRKNNTPQEIAKKIQEIYSEDISEITTLYEKARYSNHDISIEDVQKGGNL